MATEEERKMMEAKGVNSEKLRRMFAYVKSPDEVNRYFNCVLYGDGKVGKTVLTARLAAELGTKMLIISTDNGALSIENHPEFMPYVKEVKFVNPEFLQDITTAIRYDAEEFEDYGVISLDTVSGICDHYIDYLVRSYNFSGKRGSRDSLRPKVEGRGAPPVLYTASDEDYKFLRTFMRPIIQDLADSKKAVFLLTHEREPYHLEVAAAKKDGEKPPKMRPDVPDKVYKAMLYGCHVMAHMSNNNGKRVLSCVGTDDISVGSRIEGLYNKKKSDDEFIKIAAQWIRERSNRNQ